MRRCANLTGYPFVALLLLLFGAAPACAAEKKDSLEGFLPYIPYVAGGMAAVLVLGSLVIWQISRTTDRATAQLPSTLPTRINPLYKFVVEPGIIVVVFCIGMYFAYPYIAKALGVDESENGRNTSNTVENPKTQFGKSR